MPEIAIQCGGEHCRTVVTVEAYRKYTELMERNTGEDVRSAFYFNAQIIKSFFGLSQREMMAADIVEHLTAAKMIHFVMQEIVTPKFLELNPNPAGQVEQEQSAFDEYDRENGYEDDTAEARSVWAVCRENVDRVVKLCVSSFNDSYTSVMSADIMALLDHVAFEIRTANEK